ncbi:helix-turn-helix domain-containing protein [Geopsychrobacter electrodiphilus]|uniref:helix-turn-helix domain-containing protein n=1 Tax=Geopsychrobacter electrodiphilus TaxID=225196 RepID=UPI00035D5A06|nr:helix-turn-helix domain-containing protein [Geopsychrobacter electrodiphilus]
MKTYTQLASDQRYLILGLMKAGWKQGLSAEEIGVDKPTISRELKHISFFNDIWA